MIESGVVKYSALVTDINLKGPMKGWEVARLVRQIDPAFPIVYTTGAAAGDWASEGVPSRILLKKTVCPGAIGYGGVPAAQHRFADLTVRNEQAIAMASRHHRDMLQAINDAMSAFKAKADMHRSTRNFAF